MTFPDDKGKDCTLATVEARDTSGKLVDTSIPYEPIYNASTTPPMGIMDVKEEVIYCDRIKEAENRARLRKKNRKKKHKSKNSKRRNR